MGHGTGGRDHLAQRGRHAVGQHLDDAECQQPAAARPVISGDNPGPVSLRQSVTTPTVTATATIRSTPSFSLIERQEWSGPFSQWV